MNKNLTWEFENIPSDLGFCPFLFIKNVHLRYETVDDLDFIANFTYR